ncbi:hypothetical protein [Rubrobacter calidifluminis]|uniref:hypothetical protein n=1 Tax=Rubrobacter calidifluminis TaxID=1392640 RepID=UPI00236214C2|nr:hypothetical protein [Rubrobacter calidifluminis]
MDLRKAKRIGREWKKQGGEIRVVMEDGGELDRYELSEAIKRYLIRTDRDEANGIVRTASFVGRDGAERTIRWVSPGAYTLSTPSGEYEYSSTKIEEYMRKQRGAEFVLRTGEEGR